MKDIKKQLFWSIAEKQQSISHQSENQGKNHQQINDLPMRELSWQRLPSGSVVELEDGRAQP